PVLFNRCSLFAYTTLFRSNIGIHHGTIPKYIQREIINFFNQGVIKCIFSTTTITEGVNTTAKNMIIISHKKGSKDLKRFDILNRSEEHTSELQSRENLVCR